MPQVAHFTPSALLVQRWDQDTGPALATPATVVHVVNLFGAGQIQVSFACTGGGPNSGCVPGVCGCTTRGF